MAATYQVQYTAQPRNYSPPIYKHANGNGHIYSYAHANSTRPTSNGVVYRSPSNSPPPSRIPQPGYTKFATLQNMTNRLATSVDTTPLDRAMAQQAQTSGAMNAKTRELLELQALAQRRLKTVQGMCKEGLRGARECQRELRWAQERAAALNQRAAAKYPGQYAAAVRKYPNPNGF